MLPSVPHLRSLTADYGADKQSEKAFALFKAAIRAPCCSRHSLDLACTGIGQYKLRDTSRPNLTITLTHTPLVRAWGNATPERVSTVSAAQAMMPVHGKPDLQALVDFLMALHDGAFHGAPREIVPETLAKLWPKDVPFDFRKLGEVGTLGFVEDIDEALWAAWVRLVEQVGQGSAPMGFVPRW